MKFMRVSLFAALLATTSLTAFADTSSMSTTSTGMGVLENDYVKAGVNGTTGTFGSGGNTSPGLLFDSTGTGDFNTSYDYLTPGSPFDGWSIKIDGSNSYNNNSSTSSATWLDSDGLTDGDGTLTWTGTNPAYSGWEVEHQYSLGSTSQYIDIETNITAGSGASDSTVYFGRYIDPDARAADGDSSATDNVLGYSGIPDSNVAFSEATVSRYALGLYSTNSNVDAGINDWDQNADSYTDSKYTNSDGNTVNYGTGDDTIGLTWVWTGVEAGDILTAEYSYIFGPSAFDAADTAIEGGAGGGTAGETPDSWGEVSDVGSATEAAESGGSPTVTGTGTSSITSHTATDDGKTQTVAREKATSTWDVYSDGSLGTAVVTEETLTPFVGNIEQVETLKDIQRMTVRGLDFDGIKAIGVKSSSNSNGSGNTIGFSAGGEKTNDTGYTYGAGIAKINTQLGENNDIKSDTLYFQGSVEKKNLKLTLALADSDYSYTRTIGDFSNSGSTKGRDVSATVSYSPEHNGPLRPTISATKGINMVDGYTETGSIQSLRTVDKVNENYGFATVGAEIDVKVVTLGANYSTDGVTNISAGFNKETSKASISIGVNKATSDTGSQNSITAGLKFKF